METYIQKNNQLNIPVDGVIQLNKDREAVNDYFVQHVNENTRFYHNLEEKLRYLGENEFIDKKAVVDKYLVDEVDEDGNKVDELKVIRELFDYLYGEKFRFKSFMAAYKFYRQYALTNESGTKYLERYEDRVAFNALLMADGDVDLLFKIAKELINLRYQPATPTYLNAGRLHRGEFVSCFLIDISDDMNSIGRSINSALQLSKIGGGVGINLSNLRESGARIKKNDNAASGVVPVMKQFEEAFKYANQLGQRQGAGVVYLNVFHPDIMDFLSTRVENAEASKQIKTLSLGVVFPDKYYELVESKAKIYLFSPRDVEREYGKPFSYVDITEEYDNMVANPNIKKKSMPSEELDLMISRLQQESGYPYALNIDTVNRANPIDGRVVMSNLCSEILQVQEPSTINNEQGYDVLGKDVSCNLGSINIRNFMKADNADNAESSIETMIRSLTFITDTSEIDVVPSINRGNRESRAVGLGAMGLHTMFAVNQMYYGSPESIEFTDKFFEMVNFLTLKASTKISKERQSPFVGFENSKYADGTYFDLYLNEDVDNSFTSEKVEALFAGFPYPSKEDWANLKEDVMRDGLYHQNRMAVAPNGSISYINETSASLHPIISLVEERQERKVGKIYYPAAELSNESMKYYKSAYDISMLEVIDVYAAAQKHIDQGMSLTLFMRAEIPAGLYPWKPEGGKMTTRDLTLLRHYAWRKGIKTLYYVRTLTEEDGEVGIAECESCSI